MDTIESLLKSARAELESEGIPSAAREARALLGYVIEKDPTFLIAHPEFDVSRELAERFLDAVRRRARHEPFHYITGVKNFFGLEFEVSKDVLIPRPETEILVERALNILSGQSDPRFCEVGVGSGCIAVALLYNIPKAKAVGLEISESALEVAARNASRHGVGPRLDLRHSDVFQALDDVERFELIISNPPYIPVADMSGLQSDVRLFEPSMALTDGSDGLSIIRSIIEGAPRYLMPGGRLLLEIGFGQVEEVLKLFNRDKWQSTAFHPDLQGIPRVVEAVASDN